MILSTKRVLWGKLDTCAVHDYVSLAGERERGGIGSSPHPCSTRRDDPRRSNITSDGHHMSVAGSESLSLCMISIPQ